MSIWILQETILRCTLNVRVALEEIFKFVFFRKKNRIPDLKFSAVLLFTKKEPTAKIKKIVIIQYDYPIEAQDIETVFN